MNGISQFFNTDSAPNNDAEGEEGSSSENMNMGGPESFYMPNHAEMHEHLKGLFDGKIGKLATEMAEEISKDMKGIFGDDDQSDIQTTQDVVKKLMKNPKKMMELVKLVGNKLKNKMDSGEISQDEIMKEAGDIFGKMKGSMGNKDLTEMFKNMASQMGMKNSKINTAAMESNFKKEAMKEKMRKKMEMKRAQEAAAAEANRHAHLQQVNEHKFVFSTDEAPQERSMRRPTKHTHVDAEIDQLMAEHGITNDIIAKPPSSSSKKGKGGGKAVKKNA